MKQLVPTTILAGVCLLAIPAIASAETVVEKVARTGVLTAGTRSDAVPFAYTNDAGDWVGYSIDLLENIRLQLEVELDRDVQLQLIEIPLDERIPQVRSGNIDILCGITSFSWERDRYIDFSMGYFPTGTRLLVGADSTIDGSDESLVGAQIGIVPNSISGQAIALVQPEANIIELTSKQEVLDGLLDGELDAFAFDGIILEAARRNLDNPDDFTVIPAFPTPPHNRQNIACMVPEGNSTFLDYTNFAIAQFMMGVLTEDEFFISQFDRSFGENGAFPLGPAREFVLDYFKDTIDMHEQINLERTAE